MTKGLAFSFAGQEFIARPALTLWWPDQKTLIVADLHLGKSLRMARRGGALIPPWDSRDTLERLEREIAALDPQRILFLGDSYDDTQVITELSPQDQQHLHEMLKGRHCDWIEGNHDPQSGGLQDLVLQGITFRHQIAQGFDRQGFDTQGSIKQGPDISGHFHPSIRLGGKRWRCFAYDGDHLILPAFGSYTGGLDIYSADFAQIMPKGMVIGGNAQGLFTAPFGRKA